MRDADRLSEGCTTDQNCVPATITVDGVVAAAANQRIISLVAIDCRIGRNEVVAAIAVGSNRDRRLDAFGNLDDVVTCLAMQDRPAVVRNRTTG